MHCIQCAETTPLTRVNAMHHAVYEIIIPISSEVAQVKAYSERTSSLPAAWAVYLTAVRIYNLNPQRPEASFYGGDSVKDVR